MNIALFSEDSNNLKNKISFLKNRGINVVYCPKLESINRQSLKYDLDISLKRNAYILAEGNLASIIMNHFNVPVIAVNPNIDKLDLNINSKNGIMLLPANTPYNKADELMEKLDYNFLLGNIKVFYKDMEFGGSNDDLITAIQLFEARYRKEYLNSRVELLKM